MKVMQKTARLAGGLYLIYILVTVLAFNFMGDGFRDALDPYMKQ